ncbi:unnamed protein product [Urochloa humidicola]
MGLMASKRSPETPIPLSSSASAPSPPPMGGAPPVAVLPEDVFICILRRLSPADLIRAALACRRWRRAASLAHRAPPLLGYLVQPADTPPRPPFLETNRFLYPAVLVPLHDVAAAAASPCLFYDFAPDAALGFIIEDVHLGLVLLLESPRPRPQGVIPDILVVDPASRRRAMLPPPPLDAVLEGLLSRRVVGVAVLSRAHPSRLCFDAVCFTVDGDRPRAWVASVRHGDCTWRVLPPSRAVEVDFDTIWFESRPVHAAGDIYWHICNSSRVLKLDPRTLEFSFLLAPAELNYNEKYRIGEKPEDGRLCIACAEDQQLRLWVHGDTDGSGNGWVLERQMCLRKVLDTIPDLPKDDLSRMMSLWLSDIDAGRSGKVFIKTCGYGRYSFHMETGKLECLATNDGKEYSHPIYAYFLAWPPAFLVPSGSEATDHLGGDKEDV